MFRVSIVDWFSAATLVARGIGTGGFDGDLTYDGNGFQTGGWSVEVFAPGMRNPFDVRINRIYSVLVHSSSFY